MKILFITYYFPPDTAVGGQRIAKFCKYLPDFGWEPYVLTVKDRYRDQIVPSRLDEVRGIKVIKTRELMTVDQVYQWFKSVFRHSRSNGRKRRGALPSPSVSPGPEALERENLLRRIKRTLISLIVMLPDQKKSWIIPAYLKAVSIIRKEQITHIITSSPHHSTHLVGLLLKKTLGVKWLADFRDPWSDVADFKSCTIRSRLGDSLENWMEGSVIHNSDSTVATTRSVASIFREKYGGEPEEKFVYIPNAIFTEKFREHRDKEKFNVFTITYTGTLYGDRSPEPVFKAVRELIDEGLVDPAGIRIKLLGNCRTVRGAPTDEMIKDYGLEEVVEILDPVPFDDSVEVMCRSHLLLLLAPNQPLQIPAKAYDYMGSGTDMLTIAEKDSATTELVTSTGSGESFATDDIRGIKGYIHASLTGALAAGKPGAEERLADFDIRHLTRRLAEELKRIDGPRGAR